MTNELKWSRYSSSSMSPELSFLFLPLPGLLESTPSALLPCPLLLLGFLGFSPLAPPSDAYEAKEGAKVNVAIAGAVYPTVLRKFLRDVSIRKCSVF